MNEIVAIVEGETEQAFVRDQLAAHLGQWGATVWPVLPGKSRKRGGVKKWEVARNDIIRTLKEDRFCTTMFDYYGLPDDWPGRAAASSKPWHERASYVEEKIKSDLVANLSSSFNPETFVPYVQLHEFEALLFSETAKLAGLGAGISGQSKNYLLGKFEEILAQAEHPEAIDDGYHTCPSRRITGLVPGFKKRLHSPIGTGRIGLSRLMEKCSHFAQWVCKLEKIAEAR